MTFNETEDLDDHDLRRVVRRLPQALVATLTEDGKPRGVVAGGFIRTVIANERPSDIDVFGANVTEVWALSEAYRKRVDRSRAVETDNAITIVAPSVLPVQFIKRWTFENPILLLKSFDFSIARAAVWYMDKAWFGVVHRRFYRDLAARRLVYLSPVDNTAGGTLLRLQKFAARGYRASAFNIAAIAQALATQGGAEPRVTDQMARLVREVDPRSPEWAAADAPARPADDPDPAPTDDDDIDF